MSDNTIEGLRELLFDTVRAVKAGTLELDRAKAVSELSQTIINTAKAETEFMRASNRTVDSEFIPSERRKLRRPDCLDLPAPEETTPGNGLAASIGKRAA